MEFLHIIFPYSSNFNFISLTCILNQLKKGIYTGFLFHFVSLSLNLDGISINYPF
jgi:hypothetical protein